MVQCLRGCLVWIPAELVEFPPFFKVYVHITSREEPAVGPDQDEVPLVDVK